MLYQCRKMTSYQPNQSNHIKQCVAEEEASTKVKEVKIVINLKSRKNVRKKIVYENKREKVKSRAKN